jgi:hypothetical protein
MPLSVETSLLDEALARLARGELQELSALLTDVEVDTLIDGTRVVSHCHSLRLDGNGRPRIRDLVAAICDHVLDYAIPRSEISAAEAARARHGSSAPLARLHTEARRLFTDLTQSGEGGELLLFTLAEQVLRLPQIICKMSLKTNSRMHIHGADGLHAGVDPETKRLLLYWGESKIHESAGGAIRDCLASVALMLHSNTNGGAPADRDLQLLQRFIDVDDSELESALKRYLDPRDPHFNELEFRGLCLVGFDCSAYPAAPGRHELADVVAAIKAVLPQWKTQISRRIHTEALTGFGFHFICVPFPSADDFRSRLRVELGIAPGGVNGAA